MYLYETYSRIGPMYLYETYSRIGPMYLYETYSRIVDLGSYWKLITDLFWLRWEDAKKPFRT